MLISEKLLSMLAQAISQKAKSFIHYWELSQHIPNNTNFQQIMIEIILREQKHFEVLNEIISQLIKDKESDSLLEPFARSVKNGNKNDANDKEEINNIIKDILLNQLTKAKKSLENPVPLIEKKSKDNGGISTSVLKKEQIPSGAEHSQENQTLEKFQTSGEEQIIETTHPRKERLPEQCSESSPEENGLLIWTFGRTPKKDF